jgi:hypothetical protein
MTTADASLKRATLAAKRDGTPHTSCNCPACTAQRYAAWAKRKG